MMAALRRYLVAGLLVWVPLGVTVLIIKFLVDLMDRTLVLVPVAYRPEQWLGFAIPGLGVVLTLLVVLLTGMLAANLIGRQLLRVGEALLVRIPLVRTIYSAVKQVVDTVFSSSGQSFRRVVMVEYPRRGVWTLAFVTGEGVAQLERGVQKKLINLFVPTTPNPTSGFFLTLPEEEVRAVDLSVDEGLKLIVSAGVVVPGHDGMGGKRQAF